MRKRCSDCTRRCSCLSLFVSTCSGLPYFLTIYPNFTMWGTYQPQIFFKIALHVHHADSALCLVVYPKGLTRLNISVLPGALLMSL